MDEGQLQIQHKGMNAFIENPTMFVVYLMVVVEVLCWIVG